MAAVAICFLWALPSAAAASDVAPGLTVLRYSLVSAPANMMVAEAVVTGDDATFVAEATTDELGIWIQVDSADGSYLDLGFSPEPGEALEPGSYAIPGCIVPASGRARADRDAAPALAAATSAGSLLFVLTPCDAGGFDILEMETDFDGRLLRFAADFELRLAALPARLEGSIRFNASPELTLPEGLFSAAAPDEADAQGFFEMEALGFLEVELEDLSFQSEFAPAESASLAEAARPSGAGTLIFNSHGLPTANQTLHPPGRTRPGGSAGSRSTSPGQSPAGSTAPTTVRRSPSSPGAARGGGRARSRPGSVWSRKPPSSALEIRIQAQRNGDNTAGGAPSSSADLRPFSASLPPSWLPASWAWFFGMKQSGSVAPEAFLDTSALPGDPEEEWPPGEKVGAADWAELELGGTSQLEDTGGESTLFEGDALDVAEEPRGAAGLDALAEGARADPVAPRADPVAPGDPLPPARGEARPTSSVQVPVDASRGRDFYSDLMLDFVRDIVRAIDEFEASLAETWEPWRTTR